ncbi:wd-40 repeat protein [Stylonychia lemnae]|uniref:Wd-40 repeat protein n=1 Tax=Stylonychia lemnae TaxID=5949 RepID=A0A078AM27_STYLE|nr:wd-40 repeat protein [Stylonychia lemnae]|eukprot:CDW83425.1 wd-40 repeat protein [Stylonychia lemnae]
MNDHQSYIYLNGNRQVNWVGFRQKSQFRFEDTDTFCVMYNNTYEKQYIFDQATRSKIVYFDKLNQKFESIDLIEEVDFNHYQLEFAILDDINGILMAKYYNEGRDDEFHTMTFNSFEDMFNEELLNQTVFPAFHFEIADKIIIDSSQVQLFIKGEEQMVGHFLTEITDKLINEYRAISLLSNELLIKELSLNVDKYFKFVAGFGTVFGIFQNNLIALETIVKQLSLKEKQTLPILICQNRIVGESPLDFSINNRQQKIINLILSMIIKYQDHIMFNQLIDKNLCELIKQQIDLQEYFESHLPNYEIIDQSYPSQHQDNKELIEGITLENPKDVHQKYDELFAYATQNNKDESEQSSIDPDIVLIYFLIYEIKQIKVQKREYFYDGWNYFDFSHILAFASFFIMDLICENQDNLILIKILVIILSFMKLFFFLRIYDGFSFLVQMMAGVFKDLKYFLIFFLIFILQFGMIFLVLFKAQQIDEYNGVNKLAYFLMAFRISSGDFQLDDYHSQNDGLVIFTWMIWLVAVMTLNIVFMNFIIAVISESYERVMQKLVAESYRVKANMIVEREQLFNSNDLTNKQYFPNYIVVRRPLNTEDNETGEWQGFIKDLKYTIRTTAAKSKGEIIQSLNSIQNQNLKNDKKNEGLDEKITNLKLQLDQNSENSNNDLKLIKSDVNGLDTKVNGLDGQTKEIDVQVKRLDNKVDGLDSKVLKIQDDMEFIKSSLTQLLQKYNQ